MVPLDLATTLSRGVRLRVRRVELTEHQTGRDVQLSTPELNGLRILVPSLVVTPSIGKEGHFDLTPGSWMGSLNLGTLSVEIQPKLPIERVLFLISYAIDRVRWQQVNSAFEIERSLLEALIPGFVAQVRRTLARGVLHGYRSEETALTAVRGRLRFEDQIRDRFGVFPPVEVRYDEYTADIEVNRLVKAGIDRVGRMPIRSEAARRSLRTFDSALELVSLVHYDTRCLPTVVYDRLNEHYRPAVELAKLILRSTSFELRHGAVQSSSFLVDMNKVFEDFVVLALRDVLKLTGRDFPQNARGRRLCLENAGLVRLEPDISWWDGDACSFVGDVKYKRTTAEGNENSDLYQLLAYTVATDLPGGMLIYAAGEAEPIIHQVRFAGKELHVVSLDLKGSPESVLAQIDVLADRVRWLRRKAIGQGKVA